MLIALTAVTELIQLVRDCNSGMQAQRPSTHSRFAKLNGAVKPTSH